MSSDSIQPFGLLNLDKPEGWSSRDVVNYVQRMVRPAKVGHAGTLDPLATGVLVVCIGPATRLVEYIQRMPKQYAATFLLGQSSDTEDLEGKATPLDNPPRPTRKEVETAASRFLGQIEQIPPKYSAIKIGGQRAYKLARAGKPVDLQPRRVRIDAMTVIGYEYPQLKLDIICGGGTYIRSLGRDLAESLGTAAVMSELCRTAVGLFTSDDAVSPNALDVEALSRFLRPPIEAVANLPRVVVTVAEAARLANGQPIRCPERSAAGTEWTAVDTDGQLLAILHNRDDDQLWPLRNFRR